MSKILDTIDELNRGQNMVRAAYMAAHGSNSLDSAEMNAMALILGTAAQSLENVEAALTKMKDDERARLPVVAARESE